MNLNEQPLAGAKDHRIDLLEALIAASARFDDEVTALKEAGVDAAYNFFNEAGAGLAEDAYEKLKIQKNGNAQEKPK